MDFKLVECPRCHKKHIVKFMTVGTPCSCGTYLYSDEPENRREVEKEINEGAHFFATASRDKNDPEAFKAFKRHRKQMMKDKVFIEFKTVSISDNKLLELVS